MSNRWGFKKESTTSTNSTASKLEIAVPSPVASQPETLISRVATLKEDTQTQIKGKLMDICKIDLETARSYCSLNHAVMGAALNLTVDGFGNSPLALAVSQNDHVCTVELVYVTFL